MSTDANNTEATAIETNPYEGKFGTRNGVKIPFAKRVVLKGADKGKPYPSLNFGALSDDNVIKAAGMETIRELLEAKFNVAARNVCDDILTGRDGENVDSFTDSDWSKFQDWADGKVAERIPLGQIKTKLLEMLGDFLAGKLTEDQMREFADMQAEYNSRSRK
jgi:hypothetical protein